jgi:hypothetical protein
MIKLPILAVLLIATFACGLYVGHKLGFAHAQKIQTK